jgi:hypothetical protein
MPFELPKNRVFGVGLGLRYDIAEDVLAASKEALAPVQFFEIAPENYMRRGGFFPRAADAIRERFSFLTHGLSMSIAALDPIDPEYLRGLKAYLDRINPPLHSDHLCVSGARGRMFHDLLPMPMTLSAARHAVARIREVTDRLERPFAIENITHYLVPGARRIAETELLRDVLFESGAPMLLDVNNVYVNAKNYGFDPYEFLRDLPLDRVAYLHVAGHVKSIEDRLLIDSHGADMVDEVLAMTSWVVARTGPIPVVLERDHNIPELTELLDEVRRVDAAYREGLAQDDATAALPKASIPDVRSASPASASSSDRALFDVLDRLIREPKADELLRADARAFLAASALDPIDLEALASLGPDRLALYRKLVRRGLRGAIAMEMPRTASRLGDVFDEYVTRFLDEEAPRSHHLRDVAFELFAWAEPRLLTDERVARYVVDLARYELSEFAVAGAETRAFSTVSGAPDLERRVLFDPSVRVDRYAFAIHELPDDAASRDVPDERAVMLLSYRDQEDGVCALEVSPLVAASIERLIVGDVLRVAVVTAASSLAVSLDPDALSQVATALEELRSHAALRVES